MIEELRELYAFNRWATARVLDAVARLDDAAFTRELGSSFSSVRDTLAHMVVAEWIWLERWHGRSPTERPAWYAVAGLDGLRAVWQDIDRAREALLAQLTDAELQRPAAYRTMSGEPYSNTLAQMLRHVVNHSTYHRGQVVAMLRQLGAEGVSTDLIDFYRLQAPVVAPPAS